jgi:hypothetical protein
MQLSGNLADPAFEPTDDDLEGLCHRAFDSARAENERTLVKLRAQIEAARSDALRTFHARTP